MNRIEITANVLDALAFLLVTVELYGRERLEALRQQIIAIKLSTFDPLQPFNDSKTGHMLPWRFWVRIVLVVAASLTGIWAALYLGMNLILVLTGQAAQWPTLDDIEFFLFVLFVVLCFAGAQYAIWLLRNVIVLGGLFLFHLFRIDGMMIAAGTFFFVAARVISVAYFLHDDSQIVRLQCQPAGKTVALVDCLRVDPTAARAATPSTQQRI